MLFLYGMLVGLIIGLVGGWSAHKHRRDVAQEIKDHVNRI
jgi:NhaP-type Na+/H+ or K+/H+ antiporter